MSESKEAKQVVLVVEAEAVQKDLESQLDGTRYEVLLAAHPAQARILAGSKQPSVVVIDTPGGSAIQARSLQTVLPSWCFILGLVGDRDDPDPPEGLHRVARLKDRIGILAAVEVLLEESAKACETGARLPSFSAIGAKPTEPDSADPGLDADASAEPDAGEADVDPSRAAAIRELGMAIRMERSISGGKNALSGVEAASEAAPSISLGHGDRIDPSQVDIGVGGSVDDALSSLPDPSKAVSVEEHRAQLQAERDAAAQRAALAQIRAQKDPTQELDDLDLGMEVKKSRKGLILAILAGVVMLAGAGVGVHYYRQLAARRKAEAARKPKYYEKYDDLLRNRARHAAGHGTLVDPFAGTLAQVPESVRPTDVDEKDEYLNRSVPELDRWFELALKRLSARRAREQLVLRAGPLVKFGQFKRAQRYLYRALKIKDGVDARDLMAQIFEKQDKHGSAIYHLKAAVRLKPRRADLRVRLAQQYLAQKKVKQACAQLKRAARRDKQYRATYEKHCKGGTK